MGKWIKLIVIVILTSCTNGGIRIKQVNNHIEGPNILNLSMIHSDWENMISFPILFNDSLVKSNKITKIQRVTYFTSPDSTVNVNGSYLDKRIIYNFNKLGQTENIKIENYYDNRIIGKIQVDYSHYLPNIGYADLKLSESLLLEDFQYYTHELIKNTEQLISFKNEEKDQHLYIIPSKKFWKSLAVDTLCNPTKDDVIILGSLEKPVKIYSVQNLVKENNVRNFYYKRGVLSKVIKEDTPFKIHRTFKYNKKGLCTGFTDATYSFDKLVSKIRYSIKLENGLPKEIVKELINGSQKRIIFQEFFNYTFK